MNKENENNIKWSPELSYAVGLLTTDGNLSKDKRHIEFTSKDLQLLKTFKKCLGLKNKIGFKIGGYSGKKYPRIQFSNVALYNWLIEIGLMPKKSKIMGSISIPDNYFFDFLRGHFDGDGSCYSYWDKRWHSSFMFYISFLSASQKHIIWLKNNIEKLTKVKGYLSKIQNDGVYQLKYAKGDSKILICKMYYQKNLPHLNRKYKKLNKILEIDNSENDRK